MKNWRVRSADPEATPDTISADDLARRIGATPVRSPEPDERPDRRKSMTSAQARRTPRLSSVHQAHPVACPGSRGLLWRDASALLFGVVGFIVVAQLAFGNLGSSAPDSGVPELPGAPSDAAIAVLPDRGSSGPTLGPILDPNLIPAILATPTPVPVVVVPRATLRPAATPRPTARPTATTKPTPSPSPTASPPELILGSITCSSTTSAPGDPVACGVEITQGTADTYSWDFGDGTPTTSSGSHTFGADGTYLIRVDASGPGGSDFATTSYTVATP